MVDGARLTGEGLEATSRRGAASQKKVFMSEQEWLTEEVARLTLLLTAAQARADRLQQRLREVCPEQDDYLTVLRELAAQEQAVTRELLARREA